jgi:lipid-A-disaccharide synthase-like uncharacterized protein
LQEKFWLVFGFCGQAVFFSRFVIQWIESERKKRSVIPVSFWWLSIVGSLTLLAYAIHQKDPVFIAGQSCGTIIYLRNIQLIVKQSRDRNDSHPV